MAGNLFPGSQRFTTQVLFFWRFNDSIVDADPGIGFLGLNNADPVAATELFISNLDKLGFDQTFILANLVAGNKILLQEVSNPSARNAYNITGAPVDNTTYFTIPISNISPGATFQKNREIGVSFYFT